MIVIASKSAEPSTPRPPAHDPYLFGDVGSGYWRFNVQPSWRPPTDVYETEEAIMVRMEIAGMNESDFVIELKGRLLLIRGARPDANERRSYHQMEIRFGEFNVDIELPSVVHTDLVEATYRDGFLRLVLPKVPPMQIHIEE